jgi:hypothetical protein
MAILQMLISLISSLGSIPAVGKILAEVVGAVGGVILLVNGLMAVWAGLVQVLNGLAKIPGIGGVFASAANALSVDYNSVNTWEQGVLLPLLQQISAINVPVTAASAAAAKK